MADSFLKLLDIAITDAVFAKYKDIMDITDRNTDIVFYPREVALREVAEKRGKTDVDFINVWRTIPKQSISRERTPVARNGIDLAFTDGEKTDITNVKAVPADLHYDVYFWTRDLNKLYLITEKYFFWKQRDPNLDVSLDGVYPLEFDLTFTDIADETDYFKKYNDALYFVYKIGINVESWIFESSTLKTVKKIFFKMYDQGVDENILLFEREFDCTGE